MNNHIFETGAKTAAANDLVLTVLNSAETNTDRLHCGFAMLQGTNHYTTFKELTKAAAAKNRKEFGSKYPAASISDAAAIIQKRTIADCLELIVDDCDKTKNIEITGRKWFDKVNGNTYFSCWISIPAKNGGYKHITIPYQYGYGDQWKHEAISVLRKIGILPDYKNGIYSDLNVNFNFDRYMRKNQMFTGVYI